MFAQLGLLKAGRTYGLHLALGPIHRAGLLSAALLYGADAVVNPDARGAGLAHEAIGALRAGPFGLDVGYAWDHRANIGLPQGTGLGKRSFARGTLTWDWP